METHKSEQAVLYMTLGHPGSGKTFFARQYASDLGVPLIDMERLRFELFEEPNYSLDEDKIVLSLADYMMEQFLNAGLSVVVDGMNSTRVRRHALRETARKYHALPLVVWVQTDIQTAFGRARNRDRRNPNDKYAKELDDREFEQESGRVKLPQHEDYVVISGKHVFKNQMNVVMKKLIDMEKQASNRQSKQVKLGGRVDMTRRQPRRR